MHANIRRTLCVALAACVLLAGSISSATAAPKGYDEVEVEAGRFYGDFESEVLLFTFDVEKFCEGAPEPVVSGRLFERRNGGTVLKVNARGLQTFLYSSPLGSPEFIDQQCEVLADGDPSTVPTQPFASGTGTLKERVRVSPEGVVEISNGVKGFATSDDGTRWRVRSWADFVLGDDGVPIGDPADFQNLTIRRVGPNTSPR